MNTTSHSATKPFPTFWVLILGVMIAIGPLSIDMYLPALPSMAAEFGVSTTSIARSIPAYFVGLVFGQLVYGPLSDRVGRVKPMYVGMTLFVLASIICATTTSEMTLFIARTVQAMGACVTGVVTRAAIRDTLNPMQSARAFSLTMLVMGVAPILAPTFGAVMLEVAEWHAIFWFLAAYGVLIIILTRFFLKETLLPENRNTQPWIQTFAGYADLLKDRSFITPALSAGLLQGSFFIYLSISSVLFMENYGLSKQAFAIAFGANAFGFMALIQINQFLVKKFRLVQLLRFGAIMQVVSAACLLLLGVLFGGSASFALVFLAIFCCIAGLGLTQPNASAIALAFQKKACWYGGSNARGIAVFCGDFWRLVVEFD